MLQTFLKKLDPCLAEQLERYAAEMSTTVERCVEEAITDWLCCTAFSRLQAFRKKSGPRLIK